MFDFRMIQLRYLFIFVVILFLLAQTVFAAEKSSDFDQGIAAFEKGDYQSALSYFHRAESTGLDSSALHFNLGVCYYKLKQYPQAEKQFLLTTTDKRMAQLAQYNLGLTALRQGKEDQAAAWFRLAAASRQDAKLTTLAQHQLQKLNAIASVQQTHMVAGGTLAYGHDDNVTLIATDSPSHQSDNYLEALLYLNMPVTKQIIFNGYAYLQDFNRVNTADFNQLSAALGYEAKWGTWLLLPEAGMEKSNLGGSNYQSILDVKLSARRYLAADRHILLRLRYSDINSDNTLYDYLQGSRLQGRVEYRQLTTYGKLRLRYELETNHRQNTPTTNYSPTRHDVRLRLEQSANSDWQFREELQYRQSHYGEAAGVTRKDDRKILALQATRKMTESISLGLKYGYTNNDSNISTNTYSRNEYQLFLDFAF